MKILLLSIGKTDLDYLKTGINIFINRLKHYAHLEIKEIPSIKKAGSLPPETLKKMEAELLIKNMNPEDTTVLLDEKGKQYTSLEFARFLQNKANTQTGKGRLVFIIGGAYGFDPKLYDQAIHKLSLSKMTFSHQMIRLFFIEQLYRGFSILKGENYHNE